MCKQCPPRTRANMHLFTQLSRCLHVYGCEHICARGGWVTSTGACVREGRAQDTAYGLRSKGLPGAACRGPCVQGISWGCPQEPAEPAGLGDPHPPHAPTSTSSSFLPEGRPGGGLLFQAPEVMAETVTNWKTWLIPKGKHFCIRYDSLASKTGLLHEFIRRHILFLIYLYNLRFF